MFEKCEDDFNGLVQLNAKKILDIFHINKHVTDFNVLLKISDKELLFNDVIKINTSLILRFCLKSVTNKFSLFFNYNSMAEIL